MRPTIAILLLFSFATVLAQTSERQQFIRTEAPVIALTRVRVIDGTGTPAVEDHTIVISGGKIQSFGPTRTITIPPGTETLDLNGYTVLPGIVGMHNHMFFPMGGSPPMYSNMGSSFPRLYLANGVTAPYLEGKGAFTPVMHQLTDG